MVLQKSKFKSEVSCKHKMFHLLSFKNVPSSRLLPLQQMGALHRRPEEKKTGFIKIPHATRVHGWPCITRESFGDVSNSRIIKPRKSRRLTAQVILARLHKIGGSQRVGLLCACSLLRACVRRRRRRRRRLEGASEEAVGTSS
jgi:hypothetical protein